MGARSSLSRSYGRGRRGFSHGGSSFSHPHRVQKLGRMIVPDRVLCNHTYLSTIGKLFTILNYQNVQAHTYRNNSLFDPDYTGAGSQPSGFDQIKLFYQIYKVFEMKYTLRCQMFYDDEAVDGAQLMDEVSNVCVWHSDGPWTTQNMQDVIECASYRHWTQRNGSDDQAKIAMSGRISPALCMGMSKEQMRVDENMAANSNNNPVYPTYTNLMLNLASEPAANVWVVVTLELVFSALWSRRTLLPVS